MKRLWSYYIYLLLAWGSFRYFVRLPDVIEELWFKPMIWMIPLFWWGLSMKDRLVMFGKRWMASIIYGIGVGVIYFILLTKTSWMSVTLNFDFLGIALATAITEEITFSGFVAGVLEKYNRGRGSNLLIVGLMVATVRLPLLVFVLHLGSRELIGVMLFSAASGVINAWIRTETENVIGSVLARFGMNLALVG